MQENVRINLDRRVALIEEGMVITEDGYPMPSWIELSVIDVCNRKCEFCPKSNDLVAPDNPAGVMNPSALRVLAADLRKSGFRGTFNLAGYGEPLLHKGILQIVEILSEAGRVELVTNGDPLTAKLCSWLFAAGLSYMLVSMYDGPDQVKKFSDIFVAAGISPDRFALRDRWHGAESEFGLKLTNRAGLVSVGVQPSIKRHNPCYYPHYSVLIDWQGSGFLCPNDWHRRISVGNFFLDGFERTWTSSTFMKYRKALAAANRCYSPCSSCNADGSIFGESHAAAWNRVVRIGQK